MNREIYMRIVTLAAGMSLGLGLSACDGGDSGKSKTAGHESSHAEAPAEIPVVKKPEPPIEAELERLWAGYISSSKQQIFKAVHPIGSATSTQLHQLEVKWKNGIRTNRAEDILMIGVRYTVFWQGPINKDGFTKMFSVYDAEVGRITGSEIIATNGITNDDFAEGVGYAVGFGIAASMGNNE